MPATGDATRRAVTTLRCLEQHARQRPSRLAFIHGDECYPYARMHDDVARCTAALEELGVARGMLVLVSHSHHYIHWILLLACEALGAVSASYGTPDGLQTAATLARAAYVLTEADVPPATAHAAFHQLTAAWVARTLARAIPARLPLQRVIAEPSDPVRLTHSTGTTRGQRAMLLTHGAQNHKLRALRIASHHSRESRVLLTLPFSVNSAYLLATLCLRAGATLVAAQPATAIQRYHVTYCELLPLMLSRMLRELPADFIKPPQLRVVVIGAPLSPELRDEALSRLCTAIDGRYGTNEVWPIAHGMSVDQVGELFDGVELRVLDEYGAEAAPGAVGQIAVRSRTMIDGYLDDPEATDAHLKDGWFLTGDLGQRLPARRLRLHGRADDMLNAGGLKMHPTELEARISTLPEVRDVAVTSLPSTGGTELLCVGVVLGVGADTAVTFARIRDVLPEWPVVRVLALPTLPRTELGKLSRHLLRMLFLAWPDTSP